MKNDKGTAEAFASSWNNVGQRSVYTREQFLDWMAPLTPSDLRGSTVLELGFGNGSLLYHAADCRPCRLVGVELADTVAATKRNLSGGEVKVELVSGDLCAVALGAFDIVYCIGVLHHLVDPSAGFQGVLRNTRMGGRFHCWVYGHEGNDLVRIVVEPVRRVTSRLPWWFTKYLVAAPLVIPFFFYAKLLGLTTGFSPGADRWLSFLPLHDYALWISRRPYWFFNHVAFDQLVTPQTRYLTEAEVRQFLADPQVEPDSIYVIKRNGNSWKFGGRRVETPRA